MSETQISLLVFALGLAATFYVAWLGRVHGRRVGTAVLNDQKLNKWLVGLSAGATANSGFVVTGAVGLGYAYGAQWVMLPVAWMLGDIIFWALFPHRINRAGQRTRAATMTDVVAHGLSGSSRRAVKTVTAIVILICLGGYVASQWVAGQKFLSGAFDLSGYVPVLLFGAVVTIYTAIGDFRGSVYATPSSHSSV